MELPLEILESIFTSFLPSDVGFKATDAPLLLTHVCRLWRSVAIDLTLLWSYVIVPRWNCHLPKNIEKLLELWLDRSGQALLHVDIRLLEDPEETSDHRDAIDRHSPVVGEKEAAKVGMLHGILTILAPHQLRICQLAGHLPIRVPTELDFQEMPSLEALDLTFLPLEGLDRLNPRTGVLVLGPARGKLTRISINGGAVDIASLAAQKQLTHLEITTPGSNYINLGTVRRLLIALPALKAVRLKVHHTFSFHHQAGAGSVVVGSMDGRRFDLHALETLDLQADTLDYQQHLGIILNRFRAPNLRELHIDGCSRAPDNRDWISLGGFLKSSQPPLRRMALNGYTTAVCDLQRGCFVNCEDLEHLTITRCECLTIAQPFDADAWQGRGRLLPNLHTFVFFACDTSSARLARFLESQEKFIGSMSRTIDTKIIECDWKEV